MKEYGVILADPAWQFRNGGNGAADGHYQTMTTKAICQLPVSDLAKDDAVLLLWATWATLADAMRVIDAWGFSYVSGMPWVKLRESPISDDGSSWRMKLAYGTGFWVRGCTEPILIAKRGKAKPPTGNWCGLISERFEHSRKPNNIYEYAESMAGPYCELFGRRPRPGWDVYGDGIDGRDLRDSLGELAS